jgi:hypothetical protein
VLAKVSVYQSKIGKKIAPVMVNANELMRLKNEDEPLHERIFRGIVLWESE